MVRAKTSPFLYRSGGASPHHQGRSPRRKDSRKKKQQNETPPEALSSVHGLHREIPPVGLLFITAPSHAWPDMAAVGQRDLERRVGEAARGDDMLLQQPND